MNWKLEEIHVSIRNAGLSMTHGVRRLEVTGSATSVDWVETSFMRVYIHEGYSAFLCRQRLRQLTLQMGGLKGTQRLCHLQPQMNDTLSTSRCAACKIHRRKCTDECVLAPYFPQEQLDKSLLVHKVFGKANVLKLLQDLPAEQRGDAASSIVYEAQERARYPVHGCLGVINDLHQQVAELQSKLASTEAALADRCTF